MTCRVQTEKNQVYNQTGETPGVQLNCRETRPDWIKQVQVIWIRSKSSWSMGWFISLCIKQDQSLADFEMCISHQLWTDPQFWSSCCCIKNDQGQLILKTEYKLIHLRRWSHFLIFCYFIYFTHISAGDFVLMLSLAVKTTQLYILTKNWAISPV